MRLLYTDDVSFVQEPPDMLQLGSGFEGVGIPEPAQVPRGHLGLLAPLLHLNEPGKLVDCVVVAD
eukprot:12087988-Prorocentrum_lima.AAC.1